MEQAGKSRILIAGLGNVLMMDDGVGIHAIRELQKEPPADGMDELDGMDFSPVLRF
jgi:Ni,Fe-hydrogenase maturation factor